MARDLSEIGVSVPSIATRLYWKYTPTSGDPAIRRRVLDITKRQVEITGRFGAGMILYVAGSVSEGAPLLYLLAYQRAKDALAEVARLAAAEGLLVGVENVWNNFLMSPLEMRTFLDELGDPCVGAYLDTGNAFVYARPEDWIVTLGPRLVMVHFKDCKADIRSTKAFSPLLHGDVDWPAVMSALAEVGYEGHVVEEFVTPYRYCGDQLVRDLSAAMDRVLSLHTGNTRSVRYDG